MKKFLILVICLLLGFISGIVYTIETMQVDIVSETSKGAVVRIIVLNQWFNHYVEK